MYRDFQIIYTDFFFRIQINVSRDMKHFFSKRYTKRFKDIYRDVFQRIHKSVSRDTQEFFFKRINNTF